MQQGCVAEQDDDIAVEPLQRLARGLDRVTGAQLLSLHRRQSRRHRLDDRVHARRHHHDRAFSTQRPTTRQDMLHHRHTRHGMQHLRQVGLHPRALTGGENDHRARPLGLT